jgi:hypothetical protein
LKRNVEVALMHDFLHHHHHHQHRHHQHRKHLNLKNQRQNQSQKLQQQEEKGVNEKGITIEHRHFRLKAYPVSDTDGYILFFYFLKLLNVLTSMSYLMSVYVCQCFISDALFYSNTNILYKLVNYRT